MRTIAEQYRCLSASGAHDVSRVDERFDGRLDLEAGRSVAAGREREQRHLPSPETQVVFTVRDGDPTYRLPLRFAATRGKVGVDTKHAKKLCFHEGCRHSDIPVRNVLPR